MQSDERDKNEILGQFMEYAGQLSGAAPISYWGVYLLLEIMVDIRDWLALVEENTKRG